MKEELQKIIDEIQLLYAELEIDAELLYAPLQNVNYLTRDEVDLIVDRKTTTGKILTLFKLLKSKDDKVLLELQKIFHKQSRTDLLNEIQTKLMQTKNDHLIWISPSKPEQSIVFESTIQSVQENLKKHYQYDLELIEKYWSKFLVNGKLDMETFYNYDILIRDKNRRVQDNFNSFGDLFGTKYKRFVIMANGGYGKSTFVHEMARQWTKGNEKWTEKFSFLFLFRLTELKEEKTKSFQSLLSSILSRQDSFMVSQWLQNASFMEKSLFIFDGLDELQHQFCDEIDDLIYGKGAYQAHVVVTSRPCKKLEGLESLNLYIELQGFTDIGVHRQLKKNFNINPDDIKKDLKAILKVPLFNTLFGITHKEATYAYLSLNLGTAIEMFVNFACNRYRNINRDFSETEKNELLLLLGQAAQNKFGFVALSVDYFSNIRKTDVKYPNVTQVLLSSAIGTGLVYQKSTLDDFVYAHQTIAEYCAAYFWNETNSLKIKKVDESIAYLAEVETKGIVDITSSFSYFLSHFNTSYKESIWRNFDGYVPLLSEYDTLQKLSIRNGISLIKISPEFQNAILVDKIVISKYINKYRYFVANGVKFEEPKISESLAEINNLCLYLCSFSISPKEFFSFSTVTCLRLTECTFKDYLKISDSLNESCKNVELLEHLEVFYRNYSEVNFLCYIMKYCKRLKTLGLHHPRTDDATIGTFEINSRTSWLIELENNSNLLNSIESVHLCCCGDDDRWVGYCGSQWGDKGLAVAFRVLGKIVTLKYLDLRSYTNNLKKSDISILNESFIKGWKNLVDINIEFRYEPWEGIDFKIRSACNLESIQKSLNEVYKNDLELILNYFSTSDFWSKSHCDIDIKQCQASYNAFEHLFLKESNSFFIITDTVYSRYSFISEIVRQWLTPQNRWTDNFTFLFWFRLNEISPNESPSLLSLLTRCLSVTDSVEVIRLLKDANYMKRCLFIFDGLDEMRGSSFCEQVNNIIFGSEVHARVLVTSRQCRKIEEIKSTLRDYTFININEHKMKQKNEDYGTIEPVELENELSKILKNSLSVKMAEIASFYLLYHGEHNLILSPDLLKEMVEKMLTMVETSKNALHLHKNVWQTFCLWKNKDNICYSEAVDILRCCTAALESMISCNDKAVTRMTMEIVSTLIYPMSMESRTLIGTNRRYMRGLLQIISRIVGKPLKHFCGSLDIDLASSITSLMYLTDVSTSTCSIFVEEDGLDIVTKFFNLFRRNSKYATIRLPALQLLYNVAEVTNLKAQFRNSSYLLSIGIVGWLKQDINEIFFSAGILAQICSTLSWDNVQPTSKECLEQLMCTIKKWTEELEEPPNLTVHLNNLNGFLTLMSNNNFPSVHLWALWAIRHLCSVDNAERNMSNEVVDAFRCCSAALESMIICNDDTVNRMAVEIISKLLRNMSTELRTSLGTNRRYMRALLKVIDEKIVHQLKTTFNSDITLVSSIDSLISLTDESQSTCLCFNEENGFVVIFKVLEIYKTYPKCDELRYFMLQLLGNISEEPSLRIGFLNTSYLDTIISFLKSEIYQSYFSCLILANLCATLNWDNIQPTRNECLKYLERTTSEWAKNNTLNFTIRTFKPFITLIESEFPAVQLWAVWTIRHILSLNAKYYGDMFKTEGGQEVLNKVRLTTILTNADIRNICEDISKLLS